MKVEITESWLNQKCNECIKLIYPEKVFKVKPKKGKKWNLCGKCFNELFSEEAKKKAK